MEALFLKLVNLSITAGWLVLAALVVRLVFRRAPRWIFCLLWGLVALRLVCPVSIESALSLIPSAQPLPPELLHAAAPQTGSGMGAAGQAAGSVLGQSAAPAAQAGADAAPLWPSLLAGVWIAGMCAMLLYALASSLLLKRRVATATLLRDNIRQSERVDSPFVLGLLRPVIYLPYRLSGQDLEYVIAHEQAHIRRRDHWWKPLGFVLLSVYWFNPLLWAAYLLLCRDIEGACDERVIREMDREARRGYAAALLRCSIRRRGVAACPLAFGETGVKGRIRAVMGKKKPAFWIVAAALAACVAVAVCFLTVPRSYAEEIRADGRLYVRQGEPVASLPAGSYALGTLDSIRHRTREHPDRDFSGVNLDEKYAGSPIYQSGAAENVIYLEDFSGFYIPFQTEEEEDPAPDAAVSTPEPVTWTYSPMMSATWHAGFQFQFDLNCSHIEASCDQGLLWNPNAQGQPREKALRFQASEPVYWTPAGETLADTAQAAAVHFTAYDGGEVLHQGTLSLVQTGTDNGQSFYQATLEGTDLLTLRQLPDGTGAYLTVSDSAVIVACSDLNRNGVTENIVVRTIQPDSLYELAVEERGEKLWSAQAATAHQGWVTFMLYSDADGDYLVEYLPTMYQGIANYTCTVSSLEGGAPSVKQAWSVEYELPTEETAEMAQFAREVGLLLRNCTVLLSTEQGILVDQPAEASGLPQIYPVRFDPSEIFSPLDGQTAPLSANAARFPEAPVELFFSSGTGGWQTALTLQPDGSFTGSYSDAELGGASPEYPQGVFYVCSFQGQFTQIRQFRDNVWSMTLESLHTEAPEGISWVADQTLYIASEACGVSGGSTFLLYAPGTPADELPADCRSWWPDAWLWRRGEAEQLSGWSLCNLDTGEGFFQRQ